MPLNKKWLIIAAVGSLLCLAATAVGLVRLGLYLFPDASPNPFLPVYTSEQTPSAHAGYRRSTVSSGGVTYVKDYDEYCLQLIDREPVHAVGRYGAGKVCAISGQKPVDYIAVDVGSEMPGYEVFRNIQRPPFDWRKAAFQSMDFIVPSGPNARRQHSDDPALIADVVRTLREGKPADPQPPLGSMSNVFELQLLSDQLPGLAFNPRVYVDAAGLIYLAENVVIETSDPKAARVQGRWITASPQTTKWLQSR